eukprot:scaffold12694_cov32-Tisochrysis_lutea.AAC.4
MCLTHKSTVHATERSTLVRAIRAVSAEPFEGIGTSGCGSASNHLFSTAAASAGGSPTLRLREPPSDCTREIATRTALSLTEPLRNSVGSSRAAGSRRMATHESTRRRARTRPSCSMDEPNSGAGFLRELLERLDLLAPCFSGFPPLPRLTSPASLAWLAREDFGISFFSM